MGHRWLKLHSNFIFITNIEHFASCIVACIWSHAVRNRRQREQLCGEGYRLGDPRLYWKDFLLALFVALASNRVS